MSATPKMSGKTMRQPNVDPTAVVPLRIGVLGAARISDVGIVQPAHELGARLVSVAARDGGRAAAFGRMHGFERVADHYQAVIDDPDVEVIYNPLPNALHGPWNMRAIEAGKHVLTEKPFSSNAEEARRVRDAAKASKVYIAEAFHHEYHPLTARMIEIVNNGEIGELRHVEVRMLMPPPDADDVRWDADLAGGSLMDLGCYAVRVIRDLAHLSHTEPEVLSARAGEFREFPGVDAWMSVDMALPRGVTAHIESNMAHASVDSSWRLIGAEGQAFAPSFNKAQIDDRIIITKVGVPPQVECLGRRPTYTYMLEAFTELVRNGVPMKTDGDDAVLTMEALDSIYRAANMQPRRAWVMPTMQ